MNSRNQPAQGSQDPEFSLREASQLDFGFAWRLYLDTMKPLLVALDAWDDDKLEAAFRGFFNPWEIKIVQLDGNDVGWFQVSREPTELCLDQIHFVAEARGRGIGSQIIGSLIREASQEHLDVSLTLVKGNPSRALYERLGFRLVGEDETKFHMRFVSASKTDRTS